MKRILVVDDDLEMCDLLGGYLERRGKLRIRCVHTARDCLKALFSEGMRCDLVLLDVTLPDGDGLEILREIRSRSDLPVIMLTARRRQRTDQNHPRRRFRLSAEKEQIE